MEKIPCPHCKLVLPPSLFFKNAARKSGASTLCKKCYAVYESSPDRRAKRTWNTIKFRSGRQQGYEHVSVEMSRDEFLSFAIPAYTEWMRLNPGLTPSIDRIDANGPYSLSNIRVLESTENKRLHRGDKRRFEPDGMAWCGTCAAYRPDSEFWRSARSVNGFQSRCKPCQTEAINRSRDSRTQVV